jgi:K+:H+ antiporter
VLLLRVLPHDGDSGAGTDELDRGAAMLEARGTPSRRAAFGSRRVGYDVTRLVEAEPVDLVLVALDPGTERVDGDRLALLEALECDVGLVIPRSPRADGEVVVPFSGSDHDWAAVGAAAAVVRTTGSALHLLGVSGGADGDAGRLLATASLVTPRAFRVVARPVLVPAGSDSVVHAVGTARLVVTGLSDRWQREGLGPVRASIVRSGAPVVLLRAGTRPSAWAPATALTRYTWSVASSA